MHLFESEIDLNEQITTTVKKRPYLRGGSFLFGILNLLMNCEICPIISNPSEDELNAHLYEGAYWRVALRASDQSLLGTSYITAKRHVESLSDLTTSEQNEFFAVHAVFEQAIKQAFGAQVINTSALMNHAFREVQAAPHVHWHVKPRYATPVLFNKSVYTDPAFGSYLDGHHKRVPVSLSETRATVDKIQEFFS